MHIYEYTGYEHFAITKILNFIFPKDELFPAMSVLFINLSQSSALQYQSQTIISRTITLSGTTEMTWTNNKYTVQCVQIGTDFAVMSSWISLTWLLGIIFMIKHKNAYEQELHFNPIL